MGGGGKEDESSNRAMLEKRRRKKDCLSKQIAPPPLLLKGEEALLPPPFLSQSERRCDLRRTCPPSLSRLPLFFSSPEGVRKGGQEGKGVSGKAGVSNDGGHLYGVLDMSV